MFIDSNEGGHSECIFSTLFLFTEMPYYGQSENKGIVYDISLLPDGMTLDQLLSFYKKTGNLIINKDGVITEITPKPREGN